MNAGALPKPVAANGLAICSAALDPSAVSTILVVDDQAIYREPIAAALRMSEYRVLTASNGKEALLLVGTQKPDLVLLDVRMPKMDAWGFLHAVRRDTGITGLRVILLTSAADKNSILLARSLGVREYFLKENFSLDELLFRITRCLALPVVPTSAPSQPAKSAVASSPSAQNPAISVASKTDTPQPSNPPKKGR